MIGFFSLTATSFMLYQGVEFFNAFVDMFKQSK
jgi:hypothetical protein